MSRKLKNNDVSLTLNLQAQQAQKHIHRLPKNSENMRNIEKLNPSTLKFAKAADTDFSSAAAFIFPQCHLLSVFGK